MPPRMHVIPRNKKKNRKSVNDRQPGLGLWIDPSLLPTRLAKKGTHNGNTWAERLSEAAHAKFLGLADLSLKEGVIVKLDGHFREE